MNWSVSLVCPDGNHGPIPLLHQEPVYIGRTPQTRIVDTRCSRRQVKLTANLNTGDVEAVQTGSNSSALDGIEMIKDKVYKMKPNSVLHVLTGLFPQRLKLIDNLQETSSKTPRAEQNRKRKRSMDKHHGSSFKKPKPPYEITGDTVNGKLSYTSGGKSPGKSVSSKLQTEHTTKSTKPNNDVKSVAEQLKIMKEKAKAILTPSKTGSVSSPGPSKVSSPPVTFKGLFPSRSGAEPSASDKQGAPESRWDKYDSLHVYTSKGLQSRRKVAAFDIDGTIITTQSGKMFPTNPGDWRFLYTKEVPKKIKKLYADGFKIVFFTNQMGISRGKTNVADLKTKFDDVLEELAVPVQIFMSSKSDIYRKPAPGMWKFLCEKGNDCIDIEKGQSFYVGDAAGRPKDWVPKKKKDFSCGDRLFALNINLEFKTPEEFFMGYAHARFDLPEFDPINIGRKSLLEPRTTHFVSSTKEIIVMVGSPASGKTHFCRQHLIPKDYEHVNRDTLGTWQRCVAVCKNSLAKGRSVVVDNTNPDPGSRARYTELATKLRVPCRCFVMTTTVAHAKHNERFREITDSSHQPITDMILHSYFKKFVQPKKEEGFSEIVKVNVKPKFSNNEWKELYEGFLIEK